MSVFSRYRDKAIAQISIIIFVAILAFIAFAYFDDAQIIANIIHNELLLDLLLTSAVISVLLLIFAIRQHIELKRQIELNVNLEMELKKFRNEFLKAMNELPEMFYILDMNLHVMWANRAMLEFDRDIVGKNIMSIFFQEEEHANQKTIIHKSIKSEQSEQIAKYYAPNSLCQEEKYFEHYCTPFMKLDGSISMLLLMANDITAHMQIEESKGRLGALVESSEDAIFVVDKSGAIHSWNSGAEKMFGYSAEQMVGQPVMILDHYIDFETLLSIFSSQDILKDKKNSNAIKYIELVPLNKPNDQRFVSFTIYPFVDDTGNVLGISTIVRDKTEAIKAQKAIIESEKQMRKLAVHIDTVREEERKQIAFAIHDELGYALTAIKMDITWLQKRLDLSQNNLEIRMKEMLKLIDMAIQKVKTIASNLRPSILDHFGLIAAIEWQASEFQRRTAIRCKVSINKPDLIVPEKLRTPIFRIFQEALTNITRYAKASRVDVMIEYTNEIFTMEVIDNGVGIPVEKVHDHSSFGLLGIREKASSIGGEASITGKPGEGTKVSLSVKIPQI